MVTGGEEQPSLCRPQTAVSVNKKYLVEEIQRYAAQLIDTACEKIWLWSCLQLTARY